MTSTSYNTDSFIQSTENVFIIALRRFHLYLVVFPLLLHYERLGDLLNHDPVPFIHGKGTGVLALAAPVKVTVPTSKQGRNQKLFIGAAVATTDG